MFGKYKVLRKIGYGSFGEIFSCCDTKTNKKYALKTESINAKNPQLENEYLVYKELAGEKHSAKIYDFGTQNSNKYMVMDALGDSLDTIFDNCGSKLTLKTALYLEIQMISCIEELHKHGYIHRDIKPDNFILGKGERSETVLIIDFGLATKYLNEDGTHISYKEGHGFSGTSRYSSINALLGHTSSRRDDMEAIGYVIVFLIKGTLPWCGITCESFDEKLMKIAASKKKHVLTDLCKGLPEELHMYFENVLSLEFDEEPDYSFLRGLIVTALEKMGGKVDFSFDWLKKEKEKEKEKRKKEARGEEKAPVIAKKPANEPKPAKPKKKSKKAIKSVENVKVKRSTAKKKNCRTPHMSFAEKL